VKSFHLWISGYKMNVGVWWLVLKTNKCCNWCKCTGFGLIVTWGCRSPWFSYKYNFIKQLNKFMIVAIINTHYSWLGCCSWCFLMSGWECYWVFPHNRFCYILVLFIDFSLLCCIHIWCIHRFISHMLHLLFILFLCMFLNMLISNLF
jgi:hypothetical protein